MLRDIEITRAFREGHDEVLDCFLTLNRLKTLDLVGFDLGKWF